MLLVSGGMKGRKSVGFILMPLIRPLVTKARDLGVAKTWTDLAR